MSNLAKLIWVLALAGTLSPASTSALEIVAEFPQHYRLLIGPNRFGPGFDALFVGLDVTPAPSNDGGPGDSTVVTASQDGTTLTLGQPSSDFNPQFHFAVTPYDPNLTGSWNVRVENSDPSVTNSPVTIGTPEVGDQPNIPFVENMALMGSLAQGFTITWQSPAANPTEIQIIHVDGNPGGKILHQEFLPAGEDSFVIPQQFFGNATLEAGQTYMVGVVNEERRDPLLGDSRTAATISYFEFQPTLESINAFLPTVDQAGVYNFNVIVNSPNEFIAIDPDVAIGYDFAVGTGDPNFAAAVLPMIGDELFELWLYDDLGLPYLVSDAIAAGEAVDFETLVGPDGVDRFRVLGIETSAMLDPGDPTAFVTQVSFVEAGKFTGSMTPITQFVPEPGTIVLLTMGLFGLSWKRTRS